LPEFWHYNQIFHPNSPLFSQNQPFSLFFGGLMVYII